MKATDFEMTSRPSPRDHIFNLRHTIHVLVQLGNAKIPDLGNQQTHEVNSHEIFEEGWLDGCE